MSKGFLANCDVNSVVCLFALVFLGLLDILMLVNSTFKSWYKIN